MQYQISHFYRFTVPPDASIDSVGLGSDITASPRCVADCTQANFGTPVVSGDMCGGFISFQYAFTMSDAAKVVAELADYRLGTPLELLLFKLEIGLCPDDCVCLGRVWKGNILTRFSWGSSSGKFDIMPEGGRWASKFEVFLIKNTPSA
jgi:hypothetical protein